MSTFIQNDETVNAIVKHIRERHRDEGAARQLRAMMDYVKDHVGKFDFSNQSALYLEACIVRAAEYHGSLSYEKEPKRVADVEREVVTLLGLINKEIDYCQTIAFSKRDALNYDIGRLERVRLRFCRVNELAASAYGLTLRYFGERSHRAQEQNQQWLKMREKLTAYSQEYDEFFGQATRAVKETNELLARTLANHLQALATLGATALIDLAKSQIKCHGLNQCLGLYSRSEIDEKYKAPVEQDEKSQGTEMYKDEVQLTIGVFQFKSLDLDDPAPRVQSADELAQIITKELLSCLPKKQAKHGDFDRETRFGKEVSVLMPFDWVGKPQWLKIEFRPSFSVEQKKVRN